MREWVACGRRAPAWRKPDPLPHARTRRLRPGAGILESCFVAVALMADSAQVVAIEEGSRSARSDVDVGSHNVIDVSARRNSAAYDSEHAQRITREDCRSRSLSPLRGVVKPADSGVAPGALTFPGAAALSVVVLMVAAVGPERRDLLAVATQLRCLVRHSPAFPPASLPRS